MKRVASYDKIFTEEEKKEIVNDYVNNFLSLREIYKKYNIKSKVWVDKILKGKKRTISESNIISHKKYPESFKHSKETKEKMRHSRLKWMKEHPEQTAWRLKNMSYPELCFKRMLEENGLDKQYLIYREYPVYPYFIDFAFVDLNIAVEIDGSQHLEEDRKERDDKKDELLLSKGWEIVRITAKEVISNKEKVLGSIIGMIGDKKTTYLKVGILKAPKTREKVARGADGLSERERERAFKQRKVERPSKEILEKLIKEMSFTKIGESYGVTDNSIRQWCKNYNLPHRKKDIKKL